MGQAGGKDGAPGLGDCGSVGDGVPARLMFEDERTRNEGCGGQREITVVRSVMAQPGCVFLPGSHKSPGRRNIPPRMTAQTKFFVTRVSSARVIGKIKQCYLMQRYYRCCAVTPTFFERTLVSHWVIPFTGY